MYVNNLNLFAKFAKMCPKNFETHFQIFSNYLFGLLGRMLYNYDLIFIYPGLDVWV